MPSSPENWRRRKRWRAAALVCALLVASGCANDARSRNDDPLTGGGLALPGRGSDPAGAPSHAADAGAATTSAPRTGVPPLPVPSSATSNAALAGGAFQPLDSARELRIGNGNASGNAVPASWRDPGDGTKATLSQPQPEQSRPVAGQPTSSSTTRQESRPAPAPLAGAAGASADALLALLQARGVTWHRLETSGDSRDWKYSCSVPNTNNPNIRRMYEAHGRDARTAMAAVLAQMDQEQR